MITENSSAPTSQAVLLNRIHSNEDSQEHAFEFNGHTYTVSPRVFSPAFFPNTVYFTQALLTHMPTVHSFLEVGTGMGHVLIEALLQKKAATGMGTDISPAAVENARLNGERHKVSAEWRVSDVLEQVGKEQKFDLIYWNYPFYETSEKELSEMTEIEKTVIDSGYPHLDKFLATAKKHLTSSGFLITSYSLTLANCQQYTALIDKHGWDYKLIAERPANPSQQLPHLCLLKITPKQ
jgi:methylase of polypeptide subunit release factors